MEGAQVPEDLDEWQQIQSPLAKIPPTAHQSSVERDMVVIREEDLNLIKDDCSIFPPSHHEGILVPPLDLIAPEVPCLEPCCLSSASNYEGDEEGNERGSPPRVAKELRRPWRVRFEILRTGVFRVASRVRNFAVCAGGFWSIASVTGVVAALLLSFLYVRVQRWLRVQKEDKDRLFVLIRKKDEVRSQKLCN